MCVCAGCSSTSSLLTHAMPVPHLPMCLILLRRYLVTLGGLGHPGGVLLQVITGVGRHRWVAGAGECMNCQMALSCMAEQSAAQSGCRACAGQSPLFSSFPWRCSPTPPCTANCSQGNQPRVLPAVVRYLSDAGYKFDSEESNPGVINVAIGC